ncbi:MAG: DUF2181 domain-containing protein [Chloroflexi bacterium]|nr:DUF2181 domain-containing protein [Chloroflexota bacterium]MCI0577978.1 DUF2181 domain-containing protein [Chloroflexota bacterium]MCI0646660.1 DUF2181 domain-containing protein [Chloroflexota bacterium]MCI0729240.1 DUF2181 domain-containing protein [Chloroflexota bacterium]
MLTELIRDRKALPAGVQLVWHGVNDEANLHQFLASDVRWAEVDVQMDPAGREVILRHDLFTETPLAPGERLLTLPEVLDKIKSHGRAIKIDLKAAGPVLDRVLELVAGAGLEDEDLWFNANIECLMEGGFKRITASHPGAILQCPIDFLAPLIQAAPDQAQAILQMLARWGLTRFSMNWQQPELRQQFDQVTRWGYEVNIYNVPDLETFLQAVLLLPRSVTSDFNFPQWSYFGRGSGQNHKYFTY